MLTVFEGLARTGSDVVVTLNKRHGIKRTQGGGQYGQLNLQLRRDLGAHLIPMHSLE